MIIEHTLIFTKHLANIYKIRNMIRVLSTVVLVFLICDYRTSGALIVQNVGLNSALPNQEIAYQDLISLIIDERNARQQLEQQLEAVINTLTTNINTLQREYGKEKNSRAHLQAEYIGIKKQFLNLTNENRKLTSEYIEMKTKHSNLTNQYNEMKVQHRNRTNTYEKLTSEYKKLNNRIHTLEENDDKIALSLSVNSIQLNNTTAAIILVYDRLNSIENNMDNTINETKEICHAFIQESEKRVMKETNMLFHSIHQTTSELATVVRKHDQSRSEDISFRASSSDNILVSPGMTIVLPVVFLNHGSGYDPSTGQFTAPINGTYMFIVEICPQFEHIMVINIVVNGNVYTRGLVNDNYESKCYSFSDVVDLVKDGKVVIKCGYGSSSSVNLYHDSDRQNVFAGYLL